MSIPSHAEVQARILARSDIQIRTDRKGRKLAQYWSGPAMRWIRCGVAEAKLAPGRAGVTP